VTEAAFLKMVIALGRLHGWVAFHARPARTKRGWATPVQGDGVGFPDLVLARPARRGLPGWKPGPAVPGRVLFCELKTDAGRLTPGQQRWAALLRDAGAEYFCWRPKDWDAIERELGG
jgi:hypothetical protein